ncbi:MAG TPA: NAD(P) transhydrogenase subunit alpha [Mycobacteriales bacterium]|nr:NAD(P) transhydrogenase subunit alpha [Mycobacteriales bacterium]
MPPLRAGVVKEAAPGERRVALTPDAVHRLVDAGLQVVVESAAGEAAWFPDGQYVEAGATVAAGVEVRSGSDVLLCVGPPDYSGLRTGQAVVGLLQPLLAPQAMADLATAGVTAVSLDGLPRTLTRAQGMDALTSQANVAGYKSVLVAAEHFDRFFPLLITAAGTSKPAEVLVLGAGVAGLAAIGTARRLGAIVRGYDVRPASSEEIRSLGGQPIELTSVASGAGEGGYARKLTEEEQLAQQHELTGHIAKHDVVITTAHVPGQRPPLMVTAAAVAAMKSGSVIVDMGASALGGNVEGSRPGEVVVSGNGVTIVGAGDLASRMATAASTAYARNISALLLHLVAEGALTIDLEDEITAGVVITHDGKVVHPATAALLEKERS